MSKIYLALAAACAIAAAGLAEADTPATGTSPEAIVAARQASFQMSQAVFGSMRRAMDGGTVEAKTMAYPSGALAHWAKALPGMFAAGTGPEAVSLKMRAKPEIWKDRAGFDKDAADYAAAAEKLFDLAKANDTAGFKAQLVEVDKTCDACHAAYRAKAGG
jgi:cytochrome c556